MIDWRRHRWTIAAAGAGIAASVAVAATLSQTSSNPADAVPARDRAQMEAVIRDYILTHPEIIPEAVERLRAKQSQSAYTANKAALEKPFAGAWAGAEKGDVTLVMFSDYACGYCRASVADVAKLLAEDKGLKVVWREIPILGPNSDIAARAALAAARQGQFSAFHNRMFAAGRPDAAKIQTVLRATGIDMDRAKADMDGPDVAREVKANVELAGTIDDSGIATPTFVVNGQVLKGAVGYDALKAAIAKARKG